MDSPRPQPVGNERIIATGRIFDLVEQSFLMGAEVGLFETARRAPNVRMIVRNTDGDYLLLDEYSVELDGFDLRLPGGRVADTLADWASLRRTGESEKFIAQKAGERELAEETGIVGIHDLEF